MPLERISKSFKDISMTFKSSPINSDILTLKNSAAIARAVRNLISTYPGERFFAPELGTDVQRVTFEQFDLVTANEIKSQIELTLELYEPRVKVIEVNVANNYENLEFNVTISYQIIGLEEEPKTVSFALQPNR